MKNISLTLTASLMIVSFIFGVGFGYFISPTYQLTMFEKEKMGLGEADRFVDLRYINQMAEHHKVAILLADQIETKTRRQELIDLANAIQIEEPKLIAELYEWKRSWYKDSRVFKNPVIVNLGATDDKVDLRFLNALIAHHVEGIEMAREIRTKSSRSEILNNADTVEHFLQESLVVLRSWRELWFGVK